MESLREKVRGARARPQGKKNEAREEEKGEIKEKEHL